VISIKKKLLRGFADINMGSSKGADIETAVKDLTDLPTISTNGSLAPRTRLGVSNEDAHRLSYPAKIGNTRALHARPPRIEGNNTPMREHRDRSRRPAKAATRGPFLSVVSDRLDTGNCLAGDAVLIAPVSTSFPCGQGILQGMLRFQDLEYRCRS
jgi:hypothetical protein